MRALHTTLTRFGGRTVLDVVDIAEPEAGPGEQPFDVPTAGVQRADTPSHKPLP
jgi:NADPH:quinone reductase